MHLGRRSKTGGAAIALLALVGLGLRYGLFLSQAWACGLSTWRATGNFCSYFTVLVNLLVVVVFVAPGSAFRRAQVRGAVTLYALLVGLVYEAMLRRVWHPGGGEFLASFLLHDAVPLAVVAHWLVFREKGALREATPSTWLGFPVLYLAYVFARGAFTGWWLYPFMDATALGYLRVLINACALLGLLLILGWGMVLWDRRQVRRPSGNRERDEDDSLPDLSGA